MRSFGGDAVSRLFRSVVGAYPKTEARDRDGGGFVRIVRSRAADYPASDLVERFQAVAARPLDAAELETLRRALEECGDLPLDTSIPSFRYTIA